MRTSEFVRRMLVRLDVGALRAAWSRIRPGQPEPATDLEALKLLHASRVMSEAVPIRLRRYSHAWLTDRGITPPVALDQLAEPPRFVGTTAISVNSSYPEVEVAIHGAMRGALLDSEAEGDAESVTRERMQVARHRERKGLGLRTIKAN